MLNLRWHSQAVSKFTNLSESLKRPNFTLLEPVVPKKTSLKLCHQLVQEIQYKK